MKCPKCGYVSFDYNLACPKCGKDISSEQEKLNLPAFRPDPPALLAGLTGQANESSVGISVSDAAQSGFTRGASAGLNDSSRMEAGEVAFEESEEVDFDLEAEEPKASKDTGDFELDTGSKSRSDFDLKGASSQELSLESDSLSLEQGTVDHEAVLQSSQEVGTGEKEAEEEGEIDLDSFDLGDEEEGGAKKEEIELKLDDLKVNETGELEIGKKGLSTAELEKPLEIDELSLDEIPLAEALTLEEAPKGGGKKAKAKEAPALSGDEGEAINLDDLNLDIELEEEPKQT